MSASLTKPRSTTTRKDARPTVADLMHPGIVSCSQSASATEIARIMASSRVHCVAVMGLSQDGKDPVVWGIVSDLDLLEAATGSAAESSAGALARQPVVSIRPTLSIREAAQAMVSNRTQHIVVVDPERVTPVGILSSLDVARALADEA